jgi:NACHT domain
VTEPRADVEVHDARGVVVGNYGSVFQYFAQAAPSLKSLIRSEQFRTVVDDRTRTFVGRDFVLGEIRRLLGGAGGDCGYIIIKGEPGIGKTAIAATLVLGGGYVHHFNIAAENIRTAGQFLENVCAQLIIRYGLPYETLPRQATEDGGFLSGLLSQAADVARGKGELPVVLVVDALDEADRTGPGAGANRLFLPRTLPPGVFVIVTTRGEADAELVVDHEEEIWIRQDDLENLADVASYIRQFVAANSASLDRQLADAGLDVGKFVERVTAASEGNFMYLVYVLADIARGRLSPAPGEATDGGVIGGLPKGLQGYYLQHWRDMKASDTTYFETRQRPVLCFLAISMEPVTLEKLSEWTQLEPGDVKQVIVSWQEFLHLDGATPEHYRIYHRSFAEFLDDQENLTWYHDKLASLALKAIPGF